VPVGVVGELYIGGDGLAREYLNRPDLTAERFIEVSIDGLADGRLYKSGDFARYLPDGSIDFVGRIDGQVKIRGFRVESQEIEAALAQQPGVSNAVVIPVKRGQTGVILVAYVVPAAGEHVTADDLRDRLRLTLPEYMVPSTFVMVDAIPLTPNGKADRARLSATPHEELASNSFEPPRTGVERELAHIWGELLGIDRIGIHDNFFDIGGHSLLALQVIAHVEKRLGRKVPVALLFQFPTVAQLARFASEEEATDVAIECRTDATAPPLSFGQQRFWFIDQWEPGNPAYNTTLAFRIEGRLDPAALDRSLTELVRRHEALRTTYALRDEALVQLIAEPAAVTARRASAANGSAEVSDPDAIELMTEMATEPFDLRRGPLWRTALLRLAPQRHLLVMTIHHSVFDGWSIAVLARELFTLYAAFAAGQPSPLPELAVQYADFAIWQRQQLHGDRLDRQLEYWRHQLANLPILDLPTDYARPPKQTFAGAVHEVALPLALADALRTLSRDEGATLFMTLLAAFHTLLHRYTGQTDLVVGTPIAGRTRTELEPLIGFFVNMLVLRADAGGDPSFRTLLRQIKQGAIDAFTHQDVPFEKLVEALQPPRDPSRNPLFQVVFALQNAPRWTATLPDLAITTVEPPKPTTRFDLEVYVHERGGLRAQFVYNTALFTADTIGRLAGHFHTLLDAIVRNPDYRLSQLPLLAPVTLSTPKITTTRSTRTTIAAPPGERSTPMTVGAAATGFVAPRSQVEWQLARIWEELIGVAPIGVKDNFFDLGGHSLMLVQLIARIEQRFDRTLPVSILFESPTIEQLAIALSDEQRTHRPSSSLVPLHTRGPLPPFFWIHGDSSNVMLPALLGPDRPLFALEHQAHDGRAARYTEVETIAAHYLEEIRTVQPQGPYLLGGYSFGGVIAFEMAQQLLRRQADVALLFLLDPSGRAANLGDADGNENSNSTVLDIFTGQLRTQIRTKIQKVQHTAKMLRCKACVVTGSLLPPTLRSAYILDIYRKALRSYVPQPYSGRVSIYKTLSIEYSSPRDWPNLITGPLTIHDCDATHDALMKDPHIRHWTAKLKDGLTQADVDVRASAMIGPTQGLPASAPVDS
jgi:thioesterase domain-containing protein/acyl carrier protein